MTLFRLVPDDVVVVSVPLVELALEMSVSRSLEGAWGACSGTVCRENEIVVCSSRAKLTGAKLTGARGCTATFRSFSLELSLGRDLAGA